ncbi:phage tail protein [Aliivibrio sp. 1S165]|uniref:DUF2586 domain-containing protein n=1 Tax=unclassified Aliivibrio TaxID=2645654 RepID=UPI00080E1B20|nr:MULTISPECIES: DUF2586 domain-containing protein [unclassified Aliivibrio]OCH13808.1 phage tail protein [Aliivibrio sp. 1S165]OCH31551.1 phage tail protein [Aliivibrio sp. 1S175]
MAWPIVQINTLNLMQGPVNEVERHFLYVGLGTKNAGSLLSVNTQSDFSALLDDGSELKANVEAAMLNAGQNWTAGVYILTAPENWVEAVKTAQQTQSFEAVVLTAPTTDKATVTAAQALYHELIAKYGRWTFMMLATPGIDKKTQTWSEYEVATVAIQDTIAADGVMLVPQIFPDAIGKLAGRLCNRAASIADTPMRIKTGPLVGDVTLPVDSAGAELTTATLQTLESNRFSVPAWFPDYDGIFWADGRLLDAEGGDYQVIEYRRIIDKVARRIRLIAISDIGDRSFNSTPASTARAQNRYCRPLREMAKSATVGEVVFPGEIETPSSGDITIVWENKNSVGIYMAAQPKDCPKKITANLMLDLSNPGDK